MTSKISFSKLLNENIRRRAWLAATSWIVFFLSITLYTMLWLESSLSSAAANNISSLWIQLQFPGMLNGGSSGIPALLIFIFAIVCAVTGFSFLHSSESVDFYHSLPVTRTRWFFVSYTGGFLIFVIPYLTSGLCTLLLTGTVHKLMSKTIFITSCSALIGGILAFLLIYHVTILAMMLTGKIVTGVLAALVLTVYGSMISALNYTLADTFFTTYSGNLEMDAAAFKMLSSPLMIFIRLLTTSSMPSSDDYQTAEMLQGYSPFSFRFMVSAPPCHLVVLGIVTVITLTALLLIALILYKKRRSEAFQNALAFPKTASFIKVLISVPTALFVGLTVNSVFGNGRKWIIILSILAVVLLCGVIEFIYTQDLKKLLSRKYSSLVSILGVIGILCILQFDLLGYDKWLPAETKLESMAFTAPNLRNYNYFTYPENANSENRSFELLNQEASQVADFAPLYALAQEGISYAASHPSEANNIYFQDTASDYTNITIRFNKKSGGTAYRSYTVKKASCLDALSALCENETYRKALFPIFYVNYQDVKNVQLTDIYTTGGDESLDLTKEQICELLDAYKKDVLTVDIHKLQETSPIGELSLDTTSVEKSNGPNYIHTLLSQFYLYDGYENTLALLETYGYPIKIRIQPEDVAALKLIGTAEQEIIDSSGRIVENKTAGKESIITDPDEIKEILSQIEYSYYTRILGLNYNAPRSVEITFTENRGTVYYPLP